MVPCLGINFSTKFYIILRQAYRKLGGVVLRNELRNCPSILGPPLYRCVLSVDAFLTIVWIGADGFVIMETDSYHALSSSRSNRRKREANVKYNSQNARLVIY